MYTNIHDPPGLEKTEVRSHYRRSMRSVALASNPSTNPVQTWCSYLQVPAWRCSFIPCRYDFTSWQWFPASMIGHAWKSCCSSNTDSSHGPTELCSLWPNTMELAAGKTTHIPLETFKSKLKTYLFTLADSQHVISHFTYQ